MAKIELELCATAMEVLKERSDNKRITIKQYIEALIFDDLKEKEDK